VGAAWLAARVEPETRPADESWREIEIGDRELASAATEQVNRRSAGLDSMTASEIFDLFIDDATLAVGALQSCREQILGAVDAVTRVLGEGGRLFYVGAGTSGRLGVLDASEIPPTFGESPDRVQGIIAGGAAALHASVEGAEDHTTDGAMAIVERGVTADDVLLGITASGRTPFVLGALARAREIGAATIMLTCNPARSRSHGGWDVEIDLPTGPELITGSTRLKAGTATKIALNFISTCAMIRLGKVSSNLMIDLKPTNSKLRNRAIRVVAELRGCSYDEALAHLVRSKWNIRKAARDE
jgi:N-acetylmuramic acid 6-phosphate etherase